MYPDSRLSGGSYGSSYYGYRAVGLRSGQPSRPFASRGALGACAVTAGEKDVDAICADGG